MLTEHQKSYFTYLIYNPSVNHDLDFTSLAPFESGNVNTSWSEDVNLTSIELYVHSAKQEIFVADPFIFSDDDSLLISDYTEISDYTLQQSLVGTKPLNEVVDLSVGSVSEKGVNRLINYKNELLEDRLKNPDDNLPYLDTTNKYLRRYLEESNEWVSTLIKQVFVDTNSIKFQRIPFGKTIITFLDGSDCQAAAYRPGIDDGYLVSSELSNNMQSTNPYDIALSILLAAAVSDYTALVNILTGVCTLIESTDNGVCEAYDRLTLSCLSDKVNIKNNSILLWALCTAINSIQDLNIAQRVNLAGRRLDTRLKESIQRLQTFLVTSFDEYSGFCFKSTNAFNEQQLKNNIETSFWVSTAFGKSLNIVFDQKAHETAAKLFLNVDRIKTLYNGPLLNELSFESWSEVKEAKYIWSLEYSEEVEEVNSFSISEYIGNLVLSNRHTEDLKIELLNKSEVTRSFREEAFISIASTDFVLINSSTFNLLARETEAYVAYLESWERYAWPSGYKWNLNDKATAPGSVLNSLFKSSSYASFNTCLSLKRLENSIRLSSATGETLNGFSKVFDCRQLESDTYWRSFLQGLVDSINGNHKVDETYLSLFGLKPCFNNSLVREWTEEKEFDWFSSPEQQMYLTKSFNPLNPKEEDYYYIAYYPKQRFLNSIGKLNSEPVFKIDYVKRPNPGFTQYLDCSQDILIDEDLDITSDSNYYIDPIRKYVGQIWINTLTLPESIDRILGINLVAGVKANIVYSTVFRVT